VLDEIALHDLGSIIRLAELPPLRVLRHASSLFREARDRNRRPFDALGPLHVGLDRRLGPLFCADRRCDQRLRQLRGGDRGWSSAEIELDEVTAGGYAIVAVIVRVLLSAPDGHA
jgi:hypothetical protein